jgi:SMODS and SLOG-associating 2TM effector domain family 5
MMQRPPGPPTTVDPLSAFSEDDAIARANREVRIERALNQARTAKPVITKAMVDEYQRLISDCYIMKGVLFNAGKRLGRKQTAGQFTFALSGIYGFLVPLFTLQFEPFLTALGTNIVSFTAATAGAISFVVAMIYQHQNLGRQAQTFHDAGLKMNTLRRQLKFTPLTRPNQLAESIESYDDILVNCHNHDEIDYEFAKLGSRPKDNTNNRLAHWKRGRRRLDFRSLFQTFGLLAAVWLIPPIIGIALWFSLTGHAATATQLAR